MEGAPRRVPHFVLKLVNGRPSITSPLKLTKSYDNGYCTLKLRFRLLKQSRLSGRFNRRLADW